ncbi:MAG: hypothetical protein ACYC1C_16530 [Chloroflexota bacterium]
MAGYGSARLTSSADGSRSQQERPGSRSAGAREAEQTWQGLRNLAVALSLVLALVVTFVILLSFPEGKGNWAVLPLFLAVWVVGYCAIAWGIARLAGVEV